MNKRLNDKYLAEMNEQISNLDTEDAHINADYILCSLLKDLGYTELVKKFNEVYKWYS